MEKFCIACVCAHRLNSSSHNSGSTAGEHDHEVGNDDIKHKH